MFEIIFKILRYPSRYLLKLEFFKAEKLNKKFSIIYKNNYWDNKESISGPGSTLKNTKNLRYVLRKIIKKYKIKTIFDAPCGDCNWIKVIFKEDLRKYIGADIVKECILDNKNKFKRKNLNFKQLESIVSNSKLLISCHGAISHVASAYNIKQIDIIDINKKNPYCNWTDHFRNYFPIYRENFSNLSSKILNLSNY